MTTPQPAIVATISGADLLDRLDRLSRDFSDMSRKLDDVPRQVHDHESRLRAVERRLWLASGAAGFGGVVTGWLLQIAGHVS